MIFFIPLRIFTGGYHAETSERCFILSTIMFGSTILSTKFLPFLYQNLYWRIIGVISILIILILAPMINENSPLNMLQKNRNRIIVYLLLFTDLVFFILCCNFKWAIATNELLFIILIAILLVIGKIKQYIPDESD